MRTTAVATAIAGWLVAVSAVSAAPAGPAVPAATCRDSTLPAEFPLDSFVFRAEVIEPVLPLGGDEEHATSWVVRLEVREQVHVPEPRMRVDLLLRDPGCKSLSRQELIDRYVAGDVLEIAAFRSSTGGRGLLEAPADWVRLRDENVSAAIQTPFEYFAALFRLEGVANDNERLGTLRSIAKYLDDREVYDQVVDNYLESRYLRKQMRSLYDAIRARN